MRKEKPHSGTFGRTASALSQSLLTHLLTYLLTYLFGTAYTTRRRRQMDAASHSCAQGITAASFHPSCSLLNPAPSISEATRQRQRDDDLTSAYPSHDRLSAQALHNLVDRTPLIKTSVADDVL